MSETLAAEVVCLIDDDPSVRRSVARLLESGGFQVEAFSEPEGFLAYLAQHTVTIAVLDIWTEITTGMELLADLCARSPETRAIFITGHEDHAAEAGVMTAGAFAFFAKPLNAEKFLQAVERAVTGPIPRQTAKLEPPAGQSQLNQGRH